MEIMPMVYSHTVAATQAGLRPSWSASACHDSMLACHYSICPLLHECPFAPYTEGIACRQEGHTVEVVDGFVIAST